MICVYNLYTWSPAPRFRKAGELGLPVGVMPFKGLSQHLRDLEDL